MPDESPRGVGRRVAVVCAVAVALIAAVVGMTIWRYEDALSAAAVSADAYHDSALTTTLTSEFWQQREAMNEYLVNPATDSLAEAASLSRAFHGTSAALSAGESANESRLRAQAAAGNQALTALFARDRREAGTSRAIHASEQLAAAESPVLDPLHRLDSVQQQRAVSASAAAGTAATQALWTGVVAAILAVCAGIAFGIYAVRLLQAAAAREAQARHREHEVRTALARLSTVLQQLGSTSAVLGEVAAQMRAATGDSVSAAGQQSAAVTQISATIEQLAAASGSIADNVRSVGDAAQRVGRTMDEMRDKVGAIAARALSLGERAQKISEILELINDIAARTNMLSLNAAIEAARAGEAGKGFAVVAAEVRKLADRSVQSTGSISAIISGVQDETNAAILATEQGSRQAGEVAELIASTAQMLEESVVAAQQQKSAARQVETAIQQIRTAADELAATQSDRAETAGRLEALVTELEGTLQRERQDRGSGGRPQPGGPAAGDGGAPSARSLPRAPVGGD
jgi:methyl-accepting chemotaxis protein